LRPIFIILLSSVLFSCEKSSLDDKFNNKTIYYSSLKKSVNPKIVGKWDVNVRINNGLSCICNKCPIVIFKDDGFGILVSSSDKHEEIAWTILNDTLKIKNKNSVFIESFYKIKFVLCNDYIELQMNNDKNMSYRLRRPRIR